MSATYKQRIQDNHIELGTVVPMNQPFVLLVDPSNICNLKCRFCPGGDNQLIKSTGRKQTLLDFDLYKKIIQDVKEFSEPIRTLRLYKEGEPLLNPMFPEMVSYARHSGLVRRIDTTSNGVALNKELNRKIVDAGLDQINISVNGVNSMQYNQFCNATINFEEYVSNIRDLYEHKGDLTIYIKAIKENMSEEEQKQFLEIFTPISDRIYFEHLSPAWPEFNLEKWGSIKKKVGNYGQEPIKRSICPYIFYIQVINSDGTASFCVGDWPHCKLAGDVRKQSLYQLWHSHILNEARRDMVYRHISEIPFCNKCEVIQYGTLDNLDPYVDDIKKRMESLDEYNFGGLK